MRLRQFCTGNCMEPSRDLDRLGKALMSGEQDPVFMDHSERMMRLGLSDGVVEAIAKEYESLRWGPTQVPIFNLLGLFMQIVPERREKYLSLARFLIESKVSVNGADLSGTTALSHSFSTKPGFDFEYAQILYDAGGDVNNRNRFGATVAHEIVAVYDHQDKQVVSKAMKSLEWFLSRGGNMDIADGDGYSARNMCKLVASGISAFTRVIEEEEKLRQDKKDPCALCGRDDGKRLTCSRCKKAHYCSPNVRACQKLDWPRHKKVCKA